MLPRVTWLLPVKNGMPYLPETLASIQAQTYRDWQILAWDNGSTDGTMDVLKRWIPTCLPGRVVSDRPMSLAASLAEMVKMCDTEFCARIDADDINAPERLELQMNFLSEHPEVAVVGSQMNRIDELGFNHGPSIPLPLQHDEIIHYMLHGNPISHPTVLFRRSAVIDAGNYRDLAQAEDYELWLRMAARYKMANVDAHLVNYRTHSRSASQVQISQDRLIPAMVAHFCQHAPTLYGCSGNDARLLWERKHPRIMPVLRQIASYLQETQKSRQGNHLRSESFMMAGRVLVSPRDVASRLALARLAPSSTEVWKESLRIGKDTLKSVGLNKPVLKARHYIRSARIKSNHRKWVLAHIEQGAFIHPSVEFTGGISPSDSVSVGSRSTLERDITVWISPDLGAQARVKIGTSAFVGRNTYLGAFQPISIGDFAMIGAYSHITSANHRYDRRDIPIIQQGFVGAPIVIEDDAWLGTHVVVLPGVTIGRGAIVAAGSVVNRDIPAYEVWGGVPAKFLKHRPE